MGEKGCGTMIINSSIISMSSDRTYKWYTSSTTETLSVRADSKEAAMITISEDSKNLLEELKQAKKEVQEAQEEQQEKDFKEQLKQMQQQQTEQAKKLREATTPEIKSAKEIQINTLKKLLDFLISMSDARKHGSRKDNIELDIEKLGKHDNSFNASMMSAPEVTDNSDTANSSDVTTFIRHKVVSSFFSEVENTCFSTQGIVKTADGREISFNVDLEMSREFCLEHETYVQSIKTMVDPLVINIDSNVASVSDQKFLFDLDADGRAEEISYLGKGSGFLALDKNGDGQINNGSELFGTKSGDGFKDLAVYDEDGNGWIDEADSIFDKLKIWAKNEDGTTSLVAIGKAGVGAIYLGNEDTNFSFKNNETGAANAVVQKSGVFLYENGGAGTIQHLDFAI